MINHYLELHEYINKNIYSFPVKENDIILEGINWGSILKGGLALAGGIGLIMLFKKFILPLLRRTKNLYKNSVKVLIAAATNKELKNKLQSSEDIQNCLKEFNSICHSNVTIDYFIDLTSVQNKSILVSIDYLIKHIMIVYNQEIYHLINKDLNKEYIESFNDFLDIAQNLYKNSNNPYKWLDNIYNAIFNISVKCHDYDTLTNKTGEEITNINEQIFRQYIKDNNLSNEYTYKAEDILNASNITDADLKEKYTKGFNEIHSFNNIIIKLSKCIARLDQLIYQVGNNIKSNTKKNENKSDVGDAFKEAVKQKKLLKIHIILKDSLLVDKTFKNFDIMSEYAIKNGISDLYDKHNGEQFKDESEWNEEYLDIQMTILIKNFSKERIELLKKIINKLYNKTNTNGRPIPD